MSDTHHRHEKDAGRPSSLVDIAIADHREVQRLLADLRSARDIGQLRRCLEDLKVFASRHFALEEQPDGLYETIAAHAPHYQRRIETLRAQHAELVAEIDAVLASLVGDDLPAGVRERCDALARAILAHESEENNLHAEALYTEIGVGD